MANLKEIIAEILNNDIEESEPETEPETEPVDVEESIKGLTEEEIKNAVRDEISSIIDEIKSQQLKNRTSATINVQDVKPPEKSVDEIMGDRFKALMGVKETKGD